MSKSKHSLFPLIPQTRRSFAEHLGLSYDTIKRRIKISEVDILLRVLLMPDHQRALLKEMGYQCLLDKYDK